MRFFNFFLSHMVWKYQNEISPIFYCGKKLKTSEKLLKLPDIQPLDWKHPYWMTRYKTHLMDRMACTLFLLMVTIPNIMTRFFVCCWAFLCINGFVERFLHKVAFCILYSWAEFLISSLCFLFTFWLIIRIALGLYFILK